MVKIINGKKYSTQTAKELGYNCHGSPSDFSYYREALYLKRTGEFFLHGQGNAASKYSVSVGNNSRCGGAEIVPMTIDEAKAWAESNLSAEEYEAIFGEVEE